MQKKFLGLAIAAAMISAPAFADVNIYGKADMAFTSTSNGTSAAGVSGASTSQIASQVTKLGFKGSEDMGDGLSAVWQIEQQIDIDNAGGTNAGNQSTKNTFASRNSFLGLKSEGMGTILMGRHDTPYKISTRDLDLFGDQLADNRALMGGGSTTQIGSGGGHFDSRPGDVLAYISPNMNGFSGAIAYVAGAETSTLSTQTKGQAWSLAGMYKADPFYVALAYQVEDMGSFNSGTLAGTANDKFKATKLGGSYKFDAFKVNLVWEKTSFSPAAGGVDTVGRTDWYLGGQYNFGNDDIKLAYGKANNPSGSVNKGATQTSLGYDHNLSKRTTVYAQYTKISNESGAGFTISNAGSTAGGQALPGVGANPSAFALGIKHSF